VYDLLTSRVQPWVSREEGAVLRWAANSATVSAPPHATRLQYKKATAVEVLVRCGCCQQLLRGRALLGLSI
jgi:23S rRNA maturation mini-RNase III